MLSTCTPVGFVFTLLFIYFPATTGTTAAAPAVTQQQLGAHRMLTAHMDGTEKEVQQPQSNSAMKEDANKDSQHLQGSGDAKCLC